MPLIFETQHTPSWSHIDPYFHVNSEFYLHYFIDHRFQGLKENLGLGLKEFQSLPFGIFLANVSINYLRPLRAEQTFSIRSWVESFKESRSLVQAEMSDTSGKKIADCTMNYVCVDIKTGRPMNWPEEFINRFEVETP